MTLSSSNTTHKDGKDAWHWLGLAISLSFSLGINRDIPQATPNLRKKRQERRIWWTAFVRDRLLALSGSASQARPVRIKREDCDVEMLRLEDFELEDEDDLKAVKEAKDCVQKAMLCWCSNDGMVSNFTAACLHRPAAVPLLPPRSVFIPQYAPSENFKSGQALYASSTPSSNFDAQPSFFENASVVDMDNEYAISTSPTPSIHDDCTTPCEEEPEQNHQLVLSRPLGGGFGVDGEYDDYLELLCPEIQRGSEKEKGKQREDRSTWAFQLDCENGRVLSV